MGFHEVCGDAGQGIHGMGEFLGHGPWERVAPDLSLEILARNLGSHNRDVAFGARCQEGCDTAPSPITLTCTRGGLQARCHQPSSVDSSRAS